MREIKFEYIYKLDDDSFNSKVFSLNNLEFGDTAQWYAQMLIEDNINIIAKRQYTGLKDKNGVEIYEYMEIDNIYEVSFLNASYILTNISNGDIMLLSNYMEKHNGEVEITREYTKI